MDLPPLDEDIPDIDTPTPDSMWEEAPRPVPWYEARRENIPYWIGLGALLAVLLLLTYRRRREWRRRKKMRRHALDALKGMARQAGLTQAEEESLLNAARKTDLAIEADIIQSRGFYDAFLVDRLREQQGREEELRIRETLFGDASPDEPSARAEQEQSGETDSDGNEKDGKDAS